MIAVASTPVELPANTVAIVSEVPRKRGTITKVEFHHALMQMAAQAGRKSPPKPGGNGYGKLKEKAIRESLDTIWIGGQAAEMGIRATRRKVVRELAQLRKQAFRSEAEYHRFLKEAHLTPRDVYGRVETQLLAAAIQRKVLRGVSGEGAKQKAFSAFVDAYETRWRARTVCAPEYTIESCSNAEPATPE